LLRDCIVGISGRQRFEGTHTLRVSRKRRPIENDDLGTADDSRVLLADDPHDERLRPLLRRNHDPSRTSPPFGMIRPRQ
jgi:hypothetical protein